MWRRGVFGAGRLRACLRTPGNGLVAQDSKPHQSFGTSAAFWTTNDEQVSPGSSTEKKADEKDKGELKKVNAKKNLLNILSEMKVEVSSKKTLLRLKAQKVKHQTAELPEHMESTSSMFQKAAEDKAKSKPHQSFGTSAAFWTTNDEQVSPGSSTEKKADEKSSQPLNPELVAAASAVASSMPLDKKKTTSELLQLLKKHKHITEERKREGAPDISNIVTKMKIKKKTGTREASRASNQIQFDEDERGYLMDRNALRGYRGMRRKSLFSTKRLNIFTVPSPAPEGALETVTKPNLWDLELAKEISVVGQRPPRNGFEEMIEWTKEGMLWEFPINNEIGLEEDAEFYDHLFLERHLDDFPKDGPIRHFMELVTCGLSKNAFLSAQEKVDYIDWFRKYFKEKEKMLKEVEAYEKELQLEREKLAE